MKWFLLLLLILPLLLGACAEPIPEYVPPAKQQYGLDDLAQYLNHKQWVEGLYQVDKFDCGEMAAFLEWCLENEGYHSIIVAGKSPDGAGKHAWLLIEVEVGYYMPVEPTTLSIIYRKHPYFDNYFVYKYKFETIHDALKVSPKSFDWWNYHP